ncbi:glycerophosphodiester phosphodiesterase [Paenibacillus hamazuiensis]|uniref:glycerophosphodiester phosphodiesterase n=1 Tax=Paenibacillus hamazuiensis TaxID=2936508 RepID=UPI00200C16E0|nr:glycerophosphodiester phosphodiesterase family protein [Paenibacillus hamazuiensis]
MKKYLFLIALLWIAGCASAAPELKETASPTRPAPAVDKNLITAHRGSSGTAPENTLASFRKAVDDGAGYSELDVQETADGAIMVMHDDSVRRTTGIPKYMWEIRSDELKEASAGAWYGAQFQSEKVPTLQEVIAEVRGKTKLNIELKNNGHERQLAEKTVKIIEDAGFMKDCTVTSFDPRLIHRVRALDRAIKTGLIVDKKPAEWDKLLQSDDYDVISSAYPLIDPAFMRMAAQHRKEVYAWTVNDKVLMAKMLDLGVNSIITNYPDRLVQLLQQRSER